MSQHEGMRRAAAQHADRSANRGNGDCCVIEALLGPAKRQRVDQADDARVAAATEIQHRIDIGIEHKEGVGVEIVRRRETQRVSQIFEDRHEADIDGAS